MPVPPLPLLAPDVKVVYRQCLAGELGIPQLLWLVDRLPLAYVPQILDTPAKSLLLLEDPVQWVLLVDKVNWRQSKAKILQYRTHYQEISERGAVRASAASKGTLL